MNEFFKNIIDERFSVILSVIAVVITVILKSGITKWLRKKDDSITITIKKGDKDIVIKNFNSKDIDIDNIIKQLDDNIIEAEKKPSDHNSR